MVTEALLAGEAVVIDSSDVDYLYTAGAAMHKALIDAGHTDALVVRIIQPRQHILKYQLLAYVPIEHLNKPN